VVTAPGWQQKVPGWSTTTCGTKRLAADVSAVADAYTGYDIYDSYNGASGWATYGGTSLASPVIAAIWALAGGAGGVSYPALTLYGHLVSGTAHPYDVVAGGNGFCGSASAVTCASAFGESPNLFGAGQLDCAFLANSATLAAGTGQCRAKVGYDGPSGVGTPTGLSMFTPLAPTAAITVPATVTHAVAAQFSGSASTDPFPGGKITSYTWTWGDGTTSTSTTATATHTFAAAGTFSVKLVVKDSYGISGQLTKSVVVK
jgi:hypothetical protein